MGTYKLQGQQNSTEDHSKDMRRVISNFHTIPHFLKASKAPERKGLSSLPYW
jgi:hypothetical protein